MDEFDVINPFDEKFVPDQYEYEPPKKHKRKIYISLPFLPPLQNWEQGLVKNASEAAIKGANKVKAKA